MSQQAAPSFPTTGNAPSPLILAGHTNVHAAPVHDGSPKTEQIDGYVVGTYMSKRTNALETCVYLFTPRRPWKAYTIYPEQYSTLLPFAVNPDVTTDGNGSAPSKEQAQMRGVYKSFPFNLPVVAQVDAAGNLVMKNGYVEYRPLRNSEMNATPTAPAPPPSLMNRRRMYSSSSRPSRQQPSLASPISPSTPSRMRLMHWATPCRTQTTASAS